MPRLESQGNESGCAARADSFGSTPVAAIIAVVAVLGVAGFYAGKGSVIGVDILTLIVATKKPSASATRL